MTNLATQILIIIRIRFPPDRVALKADYFHFSSDPKKTTYNVRRISYKNCTFFHHLTKLNSRVNICYMLYRVNILRFQIRTITTLTILLMVNQVIAIMIMEIIMKEQACILPKSSPSGSVQPNGFQDLKFLRRRQRSNFLFTSIGIPRVHNIKVKIDCF